MKTVIVALSAAALIAATPAVMAMGTSSKTPGHQTHLKSSKKSHHPASAHAQATGSKMRSPGTSAPGQTTGSSTKGGY